jgi:hypothetical protein
MLLGAICTPKSSVVYVQLKVRHIKALSLWVLYIVPTLRSFLSLWVLNLYTRLDLPYIVVWVFWGDGLAGLFKLRVAALNRRPPSIRADAADLTPHLLFGKLISSDNCHISHVEIES